MEPNEGRTPPVFVDTKAAPTPKNVADSEKQIENSFGHVIGRLLDTNQGRYFSSLAFALIFGLFLFACGFVAGMRGATVANRCIGLEVLSFVAPEKWKTPDWCVPLLEELKLAPEAEAPF